MVSKKFKKDIKQANDFINAHWKKLGKNELIRVDRKFILNLHKSKLSVEAKNLVLYAVEGI